MPTTLAHIPGIQHLAGMELVAVASGSQARADAAAKAFGAKSGYADGKDLIQDPGTDIVTVAVKALANAHGTAHPISSRRGCT